jgi:hypothetical protein
MDEYNSDSSGVDSDAENGEQQIATKKRAATFVMNSGFDFDLGAADHKPVHAWSFTKLRAAAGTDGRTSVTDKIARVLDRNAAVKQNLSILAARNPANQKPAGLCCLCFPRVAPPLFEFPFVKLQSLKKTAKQRIKARTKTANRLTTAITKTSSRMTKKPAVLLPLVRPHVTPNQVSIVPR